MNFGRALMTSTASMGSFKRSANLERRRRGCNRSDAADGEAAETRINICRIHFIDPVCYSSENLRSSNSPRLCVGWFQPKLRFVHPTENNENASQSQNFTLSITIL
jgi:hypothetical protein